MTKAEVFWLIYVVAVLFGLYFTWPSPNPRNPYHTFGGNVILWILIFLLGWAQFGFVVH
jgi:hypothetical protein